MDNATTSLDLFRDYQTKHATHAKRFVDIVVRYSKKTSMWTDALRAYPVGSPESKFVFDKLSEEFKVLEEESMEATQDLLNDEDSLAAVFEAFQKEIEKLPDDTP